ncbi:MAG: Lrp/AsnC ligand binding domain-containing protein [Dermatophilaceae bacterium]
MSAANHHRETMSSQLQDAFLAMPEVVACHMVSGMADFLLQVVVPDLRRYEHFLLHRLLPLDGVSDARSHVSIRAIKEHGPLPLGHLA